MFKPVIFIFDVAVNVNYAYIFSTLIFSLNLSYYIFSCIFCHNIKCRKRLNNYVLPFNYCLHLDKWLVVEGWYWTGPCYLTLAWDLLCLMARNTTPNDKSKLYWNIGVEFNARLILIIFLVLIFCTHLFVSCIPHLTREPFIHVLRLTTMTHNSSEIYHK